MQVICRKCDYQLVTDMLPQVLKQYQSMLKITQLAVKVAVDKERQMPDTMAGGVVVAASQGRIVLQNTLE